MHHRIIVRAALVCGLAGAAWCAFAALDPGDARADERPATVTEQPGGLLGTVRDVVDQVLPTVPEPAVEPEPADEPAAESEPSEDTNHDTGEPGDQQATDGTAPADPIGDVLDGIGQDVDTITDIVETVTAPVTHPTTPAPAASTAPAPTVTPAPAQPATPQPLDTPTSTEPAAAEQPVPAAPVVDLPVVIGPVAGSSTLLPGLTPATAGGARQDAEREPPCAEKRTLDEVRDTAGRDTRDEQPRKPSRIDQRVPGKPCPGQPAGPAEQLTSAAAVQCPGTQGSDHMLAVTSAAGLPRLALERLYEVRPRSWIPAGRWTHLDPRPA